MISPLREGYPEVYQKADAPVSSRIVASGPLNYWPLPLAVAGLLMLATVPMVSGQRGFGVSGDTSPFKGYSGIRAKPEAKRLAYYHDQTIAVVEVGNKRELYNCELIEVYNAKDLIRAMKNVSEFSKPYPITFEAMIELMTLCDQLDSVEKGNRRGQTSSRGIQAINPVTLFSGILPGTKWCGTGDLADNYFDLGPEKDIDKCCRAHDLCPVKVRSHTTRYNITNNSIYTKSHCTCDSILQECLKATRHPTADIMGNIYFNLLKVPCVRKGKQQATFQSATHYSIGWADRN